MNTTEPAPRGLTKATPPTWRSLLAKPLVILVLGGIIVFIVYPVVADVLAGLGVKLPRW